MTVPGELSLGAFFGAVPTSMPGGNTPWAARYGRELRDILVRQASRQPRNVQLHLGPSELGSACDRQVIGRMTAQPTTGHVPDPWPSVVGTAVHAWLAEAFARENILNGYDRWIPEREVIPVPAHPGHADLYDKTEECVVDHKGGFIHTPVATPDGWTTMGQLSPGDTVFGADGRPCQVTSVYPVQYRDCYRITFDDGSDLITDDVQELPFVISGRHPRQVTMPVAEAAGKIWSSASGVTPAFTRKNGVQVREFTRQVSGQHRPQRQLRLYNGGALELPARDLIVHPYVLGCWLGDGTLHHGQICKPDDELFEHIRACGYQVGEPLGDRKMRRTVYGLSTQLRQLGLQWRDENHAGSHGRLAGIKRVPPEYLRASRDQRLALLRGMMDTDGTWNRKRRQAVFTTTDKDLAESAAELVATLGWKAKIFPQQAHGFGLTVTAYHVAFTPEGACPFRLSRKASLVRLEGSRVSGYRMVRSIEPVLSVPTRCIDVDSPDHLYLAGTQMVPVHNCLGPTSIAKVKSAGGPSRRYVVQLLLYAMGYRNLGYPVRRVVLAAWPRTSATLAAMYCWERPYTPADDLLVSQVLAETDLRAAVARRVLAREVRIEDVPITPSDECVFCFAGDTEVVTRDGIKPIRELAGTEPELLVPSALKTRGGFRAAPVRAFGEQQLWKITLGSRRAEKVIYTTGEHRWLLTARPSRAREGSAYWRAGQAQPPERYERTTSELRRGDRLRPLRAALPTAGGARLMPWAIAQGFVFGDGSRGDDARPATLSIYDNGKDEALLPFFPFTEPAQYKGSKRVYGLPRFWKDLPPIRESRTFLLSWLAGYFAADGSVSRRGQVTLCSASEQAIRFARDIAAVCGIGYAPMSSVWRTGTGTVPTQLWQLNLRRRDLPDWFFLIKEHAIRAAAANEEETRGTYWTVKSVQATDRTETVYCATVPGEEMFGLADDLVTGNCRYFRPQSARDGGPGCPGNVPSC